MSKSDLVQAKALVIDTSSGGFYKVREEVSGEEKLCKLSGKLKRFKRRIGVGDTVMIGMSPYDLQNALIIEKLPKS